MLLPDKCYGRDTYGIHFVIFASLWAVNQSRMETVKYFSLFFSVKIKTKLNSKKKKKTPPFGIIFWAHQNTIAKCSGECPKSNQKYFYHLREKVKNMILYDVKSLFVVSDNEANCIICH